MARLLNKSAAARLLQLQEQTKRQEALVRRFENNNEEYIKMAKTVKDTVHHCLSNVRTLLDIICFVMSTCLTPTVMFKPGS